MVPGTAENRPRHQIGSCGGFRNYRLVLGFAWDVNDLRERQMRQDRRENTTTPLRTTAMPEIASPRIWLVVFSMAMPVMKTASRTSMINTR